MTLRIHHVPLRILTSLVILSLGVSIKELQTVFILLFVGQGWLLFGRVPGPFFWQRLKLILPFVVFAFVFFPLYEPGGVGLQKAALYTGRLLLVVQTLSLLFYQTTLPIFVSSLIRLRVPVIFVQLMTFTLRFMGVLREEAESMLKSLRSRGFQQNRWFSFRNYRILSRLVGSLLLRSFRRSERIYAGMLAKGYQGEVSMGQRQDFTTGDWIKALIWAAPAVGLFIAERV